jgi:O-methyltransferase
VLSFIETDNYAPARAALDLVRECTVQAGRPSSITSPARAGSGLHSASTSLGALLNDPRYFHVHDTGVLYRQPAPLSNKVDL